MASSATRLHSVCLSSTNAPPFCPFFDNTGVRRSQTLPSGRRPEATHWASKQPFRTTSIFYTVNDSIITFFLSLLHFQKIVSQFFIFFLLFCGLLFFFNTPLILSVFPLIFPPASPFSSSICVCFVSKQSVYRANYGMAILKECERKVSATFYLWSSALTKLLCFKEINIVIRVCAPPLAGDVPPSLSPSLIC